MADQSHIEPILLVGGGKMGGALLAGWLDRGLVTPAGATVIEPEPDASAVLRAQHLVRTYELFEAVGPGLSPEVIVFAVKPQVMDDVAPIYRELAQRERVFLSIAAGKTIASFETHLGADAAIVRAMPNTPAAIGHGMTVLCANANVTDEQKQKCERLLEAVGKVAWTDDEGLMDAVTGVSGSGPAYVFLMIECLTKAGVEAGLPEALAAELAAQTVAGSGQLAVRDDTPVSTLRENVTSPGGTTAAALDVLMADDGLQPLMTRAVGAATERGRELAKS